MVAPWSISGDIPGMLLIVLFRLLNGIAMMPSFSCAPSNHRTRKNQQSGFSALRFARASSTASIKNMWSGFVRLGNPPNRACSECRISTYGNSPRRTQGIRQNGISSSMSSNEAPPPLLGVAFGVSRFWRGVAAPSPPPASPSSRGLPSSIFMSLAMISVV